MFSSSLCLFCGDFLCLPHCFYYNAAAFFFEIRKDDSFPIGTKSPLITGKLRYIL